MGTPGSAEKRPEKKEGGTSFSVLDSTEAQWGMRSINDSVYRNYTVNGVYLERGRQKLPDTFNMYQPSPIDTGAPLPGKSPTTITINGQKQELPKD